MLLIRFLILIIGILYIVRFLFRLLLPYFFQKMATKIQQDMDHAYRKTQQSHQSEGTIRVDYTPPKKSAKYANDESEFIDYEEVK